MGREDQGVAKSRSRYQVIPRTLCFVMHDQDVLLLREGPHKRLWAGLYNGVGGHVEPGEDIFSAVIREVREETGLAVRDVRLRGLVHVDAGDPITGVLFFVFTAIADDGQVEPSEEGTLEWAPVPALPVAEMVEDVPVLLSRVLAMGPNTPPFFATSRYDENDRLVIAFADQEGMNR